MQERIAALRQCNAVPDTLMLLQHPHVYTLGRRGNEENILLSAEELASYGIAVHRVDRGGDVTYHGPGQLVGYPILKLPDSRRGFVDYIRALESALLAAVRECGVPAGLKDGFSGVWVGDEKMCAIGVKIDVAGVTRHGFALNVDPDMSYFRHIVPCGISDKGVTSLRAQLGHSLSWSRVERAVIRHVAERFGLEPRAADRRRVPALLGI